MFKGMIDFSPVVYIVLYSHLHCVHFIDLKSYFVFISYDFVSFNQIHLKRRQLDNVILAGIIEKRESNAIFAPLFRL